MLVTLDVSVAKRSAPAPLRFIFALGIASQAVTMRSAIVNLSTHLSSVNLSGKSEEQYLGALITLKISQNSKRCPIGQTRGLGSSCDHKATGLPVSPLLIALPTPHTTGLKAES